MANASIGFFVICAFSLSVVYFIEFISKKISHMLAKRVHNKFATKKPIPNKELVAEDSNIINEDINHDITNDSSKDVDNHEKNKEDEKIVLSLEYPTIINKDDNTQISITLEDIQNAEEINFFKSKDIKSYYLDQITQDVNQKIDISNQEDPVVSLEDNDSEILNDDSSLNNGKVKLSDILEQENIKTQIPKCSNNKPYILPDPNRVLDKSKSNLSNTNKTSADIKGERVIEILNNFGIQAELLNTYIGPSVTKFEIKPDSSVKINRIMNIQDNIKMELAAKDIRIEAPIPGRSAVGIEIPNVEPIPVRMIDLTKDDKFNNHDDKLTFALGKDLMGNSIVCDLAKMPHLLIAGATGSGKSVCINTIITSFLLRSNPDELKLVLVDPKKVEFTPYKDIPHLLWPIIDDPIMASNMLKRIVVMMEDRYDKFADVGVRNIEQYNTYVKTNNTIAVSDAQKMNALPYIVIVIDDISDLMAIAGKEVELSIQRITQLARASGIHLIATASRLSNDVVTNTIKSNIPCRISFAFPSKNDSKTILDVEGAEKLLGNGDMLYRPVGTINPLRLQGVYVTDKEIQTIVKDVKAKAKPIYEDSYYEFLTNMNSSTIMSASSVSSDSQDSLYDEVVEFIKHEQKASTSLLQRRFGIGYNCAARLIDTLEDRGLIGPAKGSKAREVYIKDDE